MNAAALERAAGSGIGASVAGLYNRQPMADTFRQASNQVIRHAEGKARRQQPANQGMPGTSAQDEVDQMGADIIESEKTPLSIRVVREGMHRGAALMGKAKQSKPGSTFFDENDDLPK
jgi:hypothetical protein